jgi:4-amino-4-deoxy-L-arabinose transferase-like glycosyltransferase
MMDLGELIVEGERPVHWKISYSAEPLYMYLLALAMPLWGFTVFAARVVNRFCGLLLIPLVYVFARRLFGRRSALVASGALAVTWWAVLFSRVALRGITLPLVLVLAVYCLWRGLSPPGDTGQVIEAVGWGWLSAGGMLFGLSLYTFTSARSLVFLLPAVLAHAAVVRVARPSRIWRIALVTVGLAALVAGPFAYEVIFHPGTPEERLDQLGDVLSAIRAGNLRPVLKQLLATTGMLAVSGDPNWRYNVASRAAFGPALGTLAMVGILVGVTRSHRPRYFLLVPWLLLGWAPSVLAPGAPSFVRAIGALPPAAILVGVGAEAIWDWAGSSVGGQVKRLANGVLALLLVVAGLSTYRALFLHWPAQPQVREIYQASLTEAFRDLTGSGLEGPVWISVPFPDDRHLLLAKRAQLAMEIEPRWFDGSRALILPPARGVRRYLFGDFAIPDPLLAHRWLGGAEVALEGRPTSTDLGRAYRLYEVRGGDWVQDALSKAAAGSTASLGRGGDQPVALPVRFEGVAALVGYELPDGRVRSGQELAIVAYWRVAGPGQNPVASFVHLLDGQDHVVGQYDGFDVPWWYWEPQAIIAQVYRFTVGETAGPGSHWLEAGLYSPETMRRVQLVSDSGRPISDRIILGDVVVQ